MKILIRQEQRRRHDYSTMLSARLELHLRMLIHDIKEGYRDQVVEFQQAVQYAPAEMKMRLLKMLDPS